jgi:hypothetical protein
MESSDLTQDKLFMDLMTAYLAQMDSAVRISKTLCEHYEEKDKELTGDDIICGLIYRLMVPMEQDEMDTSLGNAKEILSGDEEEGEDGELKDNLDYDEIEEIYEKPEISRKIKTNSCECEVCSKVRECLINYKSYEPNDQLAQKFKDSIQETCEKYKIYI